MIRVRWLTTQWPSSMQLLAKRLKTMPFGPETPDGFRLERVRESHIDGEYIEKVEYDVKVVDPFGGEVLSRRMEYRRTRFQVLTTFPQVEIRNGPTSIRAFVNRLAEANEFSLAIAAVNADVGKWADAFCTTTGWEIRLESIQAGGIQFDRSVSGRILLQGGNELRKILAGLIGSRTHYIEKAILKVQHPDGIQRIQMCRDGSVRVTGGGINDTLELLRTTLITSISEV
jgi:hypothetical protein